MSTVVSRLTLRSISHSSRFCKISSSSHGRFLSMDSNKVDEPFKVPEAETVDTPPPPMQKLLVLGGSGFVGSHVCQEALHRGLTVASLNSGMCLTKDTSSEIIGEYLWSGMPSIKDSWADNVLWYQGNLLAPETLKNAFTGVTSVISCVGGFGSNSQMYMINGSANINAITAAAEEGVKRFVYVSAADFGVVNYLLQGYYKGKRAAETEVLTRFPYGGVILRPGFIHGTRRVGSMKIPMSVVGSPLEMVLQHAKPLIQLPLIGPLFTPPVNVTVVARVAIRAATNPVFPPGIVDVHGILRYSQQRSK